MMSVTQRSIGGMVTAPDAQAAESGARILAEGGGVHAISAQRRRCDRLLTVSIEATQFVPSQMFATR